MNHSSYLKKIDILLISIDSKENTKTSALTEVFVRLYRYNLLVNS